jgi:hypothetical protein
MVLGDAPERLGTAVGSRTGAPPGRWRWLDGLDTKLETNSWLLQWLVLPGKVSYVQPPDIVHLCQILKSTLIVCYQ